jgi:cobalt-zinc-cadmium efflux system protein
MSGVRLAIAAIANVGFAIVQVAVGLFVGSVVVLADAAHQVVDAVGLVIALVAVRLAKRSASPSMSFGWGKADALGAYTSGLLLVGSVVWIVFEAVERFREPVEVAGGGVVAIGLAGIAVNGASVLVLGGGGHLAIKAARLHLLVDLAGSVIVVVAGALLIGSSAYWIDPLASLAVNVLVLRGTWQLLRSASGELLDRAPDGHSSNDVARVLRSDRSVADVHHVHSRSLGPDATSVTAHVVLEGSRTVHDAQHDLVRLRERLKDQLGVDHATLQVECHACGDTSHLAASSVR